MARESSHQMAANSRPVNRLKVPVLAGFICSFAWLQPVWSQDAHTAKLIEGAKKEAKFVWYTAMSTSDSRPLVDAFEKQYPFIKVDLVRAGGQQIMNRAANETKAGKWLFDAVTASGVNLLIQYKIIAPYVSPESVAYPEQFKEPAGHWTAIYTSYLVVGYNTRMVPEAEAPRDWGNLLDPKWKGKITIDQEEYPWFAALQSAWGKEKTHGYMTALAKQDISWRTGHNLILQLVLAGEAPLAIVYAHGVESEKKKGAPIEWVTTLDPIPVVPITIGLSAKPKNPNTARLFIDFILSKRGQGMMRSFNRISARSDIEPLSPRMAQSKLKLRVVPEDLETRFNDYLSDFKRIFGSQGK
jgi:iron(III) transport system substrate-binding protein